MELSDEMVATLEEFLRADSSGKLRQEIITALAALQQRLTTQARRLQSPRNFQTIDAVSQATQSAMLVMMMIEDEHPARHERRAPWQT